MRKIFYAVVAYVIIHILKAPPPNLLIALLFLYSCAATPRYVYQASSQNLPSLKKKGDIQADAMYSTGGKADESNTNSKKSYSRGVDGNFAIAVSNHWAITGSLNYKSERLVFDGFSSPVFAFSSIGSNTMYKRLNWEVGGGYYTCVDARKVVWLQLFAGVGSGRYLMLEDFIKDGEPITFTHDARVVRFYLSPR
jgi:hypothetical protein